jgi:hypothetical protein
MVWLIGNCFSAVTALVILYMIFIIPLSILYDHVAGIVLKKTMMMKYAKIGRTAR